MAAPVSPPVRRASRSPDRGDLRPGETTEKIDATASVAGSRFAPASPKRTLRSLKRRETRFNELRLRPAHASGAATATSRPKK